MTNEQVTKIADEVISLLEKLRKCFLITDHQFTAVQHLMGKVKKKVLKAK